jgi:serine/threonine protein kinase
MTDTFPDFTGRLVGNDRYLLEGILGTGAYGKVYKALDFSSNPDNPAHFAIKCLIQHPVGSRHEEFQLREIALHERVSNHPNIVTFHQVFYENDYVYVVLDLMDGGDLFSAIVERKIFQKNNTLIRESFVQLVDAVQHCHEKDVYHRDLKPENILCDKKGMYLSLADFGLCTDRPVTSDFWCGSGFYMSPGKHLAIAFLRFGSQCGLY